MHFPYLAYGMAAALLVVLAALLGLRKRWIRLRVGSVTSWVRVHNWLGGAAFLLALLHARFHLGGTLTAWLLVLLGLTAVSGGVGVVLQSIIPKLMTSRLADESPQEDLQPIFTERWREVHEIVASICKERPFETESFEQAELSRFYREAIVPFFRAPLSKRALLSNEVEATLAFDALRGGVDPRLHGYVDRIRAICQDALERAEEARYRRAMEGWLLLHVPLAMTTLVLLFVHAFAAIYY